MKPAPEKPPRRKGKPLAMQHALDKAAAECVEELLLATATDGGRPWFNVIRRKMRILTDYIAALNTKGDE